MSVPKGGVAAERNVYRGRASGSTAPRASWHRHVPELAGEELLSPRAWDALVDAAAAGHPVTAEQDSTTIGLWNWSGGGIVAWRIGGWICCDLPGDNCVMVIAGQGASLSPRVADRLVEVLVTRDVRFLTWPTARLLAPLAERAGFPLGARRDDADYVLSAKRLAALGQKGSGAHGKALRRLEARLDLARHAGRAIVRTGLLADSSARIDFLAMCEVWRSAKEARSGGTLAVEAQQELRRLAAWPSGTVPEQVRLFTLHVDGRPAAAAAVRPMRGATLMGVAFKADPGVPGAAELLRREVARRGLAEFGGDCVWNIQQDDGLPGLRRAKLSYGPTRLEPKFAAARGIGAHTIDHDERQER